MNTSTPQPLGTGPSGNPLSPIEDCPQDYTYKTTLLEKGKLAPAGFVWMELKIQNWDDGRRSAGRFAAPVPKGLSKEQKEYWAARVRLSIKEKTGK